MNRGELAERLAAYPDDWAERDRCYYVQARYVGADWVDIKASRERAVAFESLEILEAVSPGEPHRVVVRALVECVVTDDEVDRRRG